MNLIEVFANRRSGHHLFLTWLISNITKVKDERETKLKRISWISENVCHFNDATYHAHFDLERVKREINEIIDSNPDYFFINYEETRLLNKVNNEGSRIYNSKPTKVVFIRDFLNNMASKWAVSDGLFRELYYGFKYEEQIIENIGYWKRGAKNYLSGEFISFRYEDLLNSSEKRKNFLKDNFSVDEIYPIEGLNGTNSSFNTKNYENRYQEICFSDLFKKIVKSDSELIELINEIGYNKIELL